MQKELDFAAQIEQRLALHKEVMEALEKYLGMDRSSASKEAFRRLKVRPRLHQWRAFFTTLEIEGYSLPHK